MFNTQPLDFGNLIDSNNSEINNDKTNINNYHTTPHEFR